MSQPSRIRLESNHVLDIMPNPQLAVNGEWVTICRRRQDKGATQQALNNRIPPKSSLPAFTLGRRLTGLLSGSSLFWTECHGSRASRSTNALRIIALSFLAPREIPPGPRLQGFLENLLEFAFEPLPHPSPGLRRGHGQALHKNE